MNTSPRKSAPFHSAARLAKSPQEWPLANVQHMDNLSAAQDMLAFMQAAFVTDDGGMMLSASAARGVGEILNHIQLVMADQHSN